MARSVFGDAIDYRAVRVYRAKWWPFQPRDVVMAPDGGIWFHPRGLLSRDDFSTAHVRLRALFMHEMTHVWQHQRGLCLILRRHPFCRYRYRVTCGKALASYGIEQQAMIVEHAFGARCAGAPDATLEALLKGAGMLTLSR